MRGHRILAMARKEIIQILRDSRSLAIVVLMPPILMLMFGYGVSLDTKGIPLCAFDREGSQQSQDLLKRFQSSQYFKVVGTVDNYRALLRAIDDGTCRIAIVIPPDFSRKLNAGGPVSVQALVDGIDDNTANLSFGYSETVVRGFSSDVQLDWTRRRGLSAAPRPLRVETRTLFNEDLESKAFIAPGVIALVMAVIGTFLTSLTIAREWERGTMEQLISTPVRSSEIMVGKLAPYFIIGLLDTALCAAIAVWWFRVPFRGNWSTFLLSSFLFLTVVLATGYLISVIAKTQLAASQTALVSTFLPAFLLSGFIYPIDQMPPVVRAITRVIPARYYVDMTKRIFLKAGSIPVLRQDLIDLLILAAVVGILATRAFQKKLD
jgi:ABC-2 type transport system permease protein